MVLPYEIRNEVDAIGKCFKRTVNWYDFSGNRATKINILPPAIPARLNLLLTITLAQ